MPAGGSRFREPPPKSSIPASAIRLGFARRYLEASDVSFEAAFQLLYPDSLRTRKPLADGVEMDSA